MNRGLADHARVTLGDLPVFSHGPVQFFQADRWVTSGIRACSGSHEVKNIAKQVRI